MLKKSALTMLAFLLIGSISLATGLTAQAQVGSALQGQVQEKTAPPKAAMAAAPQRATLKPNLARAKAHAARHQAKATAFAKPSKIDNVRAIPASQGRYVPKSTKGWSLLHSQDFETAMAPWVHTNGAAFPAGWGRQSSGIHSAYTPPDAGSWSLWLDSDAAGSGNTQNDTTQSPVIATTSFSQLILKWGIGYDSYGGDILQMVYRVHSGGVWSAWTIGTAYTTSTIPPRMDSVIVASPGDSVQMGFYYHSSWGWYCAIDNVTIAGELTLPIDLAMQTIDTPSTVVVEPGVGLTPMVTVLNGGTQPLSDFQVIYQIDDGAKALVYCDTASISSPDTLISGADTAIAFDGFTPSLLTDYTVIAFVVAAGDSNPANDTLHLAFRSYDHDIGATVINAPDAVFIPPDSTVAVTATYHNYASTAADFVAHYNIYQGPTQVFSVALPVTGLAAGADTTITIADWSAPHAVDDYQAEAYGEIDLDLNPANDTARFSFRTYDRDIATTAITVPADHFVHPDSTIAPTATYHNGGLEAGTFDASYRIDTAGVQVYLQTVTIADLAAGADTTVIFADWAGPHDINVYTVQAYGHIDLDLDPTNDTLNGYFMTFNELVGHVSDDNNGGAPLAGVAITTNGPGTYGTTTDSTGNYSFLDMTAGTYIVSASLTGYSPESVTGITIVDGAQTTLDITMGYPVLAYGPADSMYIGLSWGAVDSTTWDLTLTNNGTRDLHYSVSWPETTLVKGAKGPVSLVLDDGSRENDIGVGGTSQFMWLNKFSPAADEFPFLLQQVQLYFSTAGLVTVGDSIQIVVYENTAGSADPATGSNLLYQYSTTVQAVDAWSIYDLPAPVLLNGPGDVVIGAIGLKVPGTSYWPASMDQTTTQARSWAGWWNTAVHPEPPTLPPDNWTLIDTYFPGNWLIRGYGNTANAPWLTIDPAAGTIGVSNSHTLNVTFKAAGLDSFTDWGANVRINSDGEIAKAMYIVPAYLHVLGSLGVAGNPVEQPKPMVFALRANYPNPASGQTTFSFGLPKAQEYSLKVYNIAGQLVHSINNSGKAGLNNVAWNTRKIAGGVYFYTLSSGGKQATRKLVVIK